jgi:hypothetical protein
MTCARNIALLLMILAALAAGPVHACTPPERPFLPQAREDMRIYSDLIREDFEIYIGEVQDYFRCIDEDRARAFSEAREVTEDYGRFIDACLMKIPAFVRNKSHRSAF